MERVIGVASMLRPFHGTAGEIDDGNIGYGR